MKHLKIRNKTRIIAIVLLLGPAHHALAGTVYGEVSGPSNVINQNLEVLHDDRVLDRIHIRPDGGYQIFLPKGLYRVRICVDNVYWAGRLLVDRKSSRQDISLSNTGDSC